MYITKKNMATRFSDTNNNI